MFISVLGQSIFYQRNDKKGRPVLLLHGWGCGADTMHRLFSFLDKAGKAVIALDFPGHGQSSAPQEYYTVYDYARTVSALLEELNIEKPDIIAHSFGARVALILASEGKVNRLLITGGAGMKPRFSLRKKLSVLGYKLRKRLGLKTESCGSDDYKRLSERDKRIFVRIVNKHLEREAKMVSCPTLLVWGEKDDQTPPYMAKKLRRRIKDSAIVWLKDSGHFAFLEKEFQFNAIALQFFKEDSR